MGSLRDREVACSASDRQGSNFESCVWRTVSSQTSHHPQEVLLAQFSLYVHKGGLKPDSFHFLHQHKRSIYLIYKWANTAFWQRCDSKSQLKSCKCLVYQGADNAFRLCIGRTDVNQMLTKDVDLKKVKLKTWRLCLQANNGVHNKSWNKWLTNINRRANTEEEENSGRRPVLQ